MKTRIAALFAVAGLAGVASAQTFISSIEVAGANMVAPGQWEVDISGGDSGQLTVTVFGTIIEPGNILALTGSNFNVDTQAAGVNAVLGNAAYSANYNFLGASGFPPAVAGTSIAYQAGLVNFPSAQPSPTLGVSTVEALGTYTIDYSLATDGATIEITNDVSTAAGTTAWFNFLGNWSPSGPVQVSDLRDSAATVTFVPAPGAFALLGLGGLVATRRRR